VRFHQRLEALAAPTAAERLRAIRKWRYVLLKEYLEGVDDAEQGFGEMIYTLGELEMFWDHFDCHAGTFLPELNASSLKWEMEYSEEQFRCLMRLHREWLKEEERGIRGS
jgi:hypothetical protein